MKNMKFTIMISRLMLIVFAVSSLLVMRSTRLESIEMQNELNYQREVLNEIQMNLDSIPDTIIENQMKLTDDINDKIKTILTEQDITITGQIKYYDIQAENVGEEELVLYELPNCNTDFKAYMDYRCITDTTTEQWKLQQIAYTDEYGLRKIGDDYCVALGSYYSETIGDRFKITLENGNEFTVIMADLKQDIHTDWKNQYSPVYDNDGNFYSANIIEFFIDEYKVDDMVSILGTISYYDKFEGNITSIEKINTKEIEITET